MRLHPILLALALACTGKIDDSGSGDGDGDGGDNGIGGDDGGTDPDKDGDGYDIDDDCNDDEPSIHPGASEVCDGVDQNCNGTADEGLKVDDYYPDADSDGYGDSELEVTDTGWKGVGEGCDPPAGYALGNTDCDDTNPDAHPGLQELCDPDDVDENCNGVSDNNDSSALAKTKTYYWPDNDDDGYGGEGTTPQYNCDPNDVYDTPNDDDCDDDNDAVSPGTPEFCDDGVDNDCNGTTDICEVAGEYSLESPEARKFLGETAGDGLGTVIAGVGDTNGDGFDDILLGSVPSTTAATLVLGPVTGRDDLDLFAQATLTVASAADGAGSALAPAGDVDVDGNADVLVGAPLDDAGATDAGAFFVSAGPMTGAVSLSSTWKFSGMEAGDHSGAALAGGTDINGDGLQDIFAGAPGSTSGAGAAHIVYGPITTGSDLADTVDVSFLGTGTQALGSSVALADDLDGDGHVDVVVGAPASSTGSVYAFHGTFSGSIDESEAEGIFTGAANDALGTSVCAAGDVDGDGHTDLIVGAPGADGGASNGGAAYLVLGPVEGAGSVSASFSAKIQGESVDAAVGVSVASSDFDDDGNFDVLVGGAWNGAKTSGEAYLYLGPVSGTVGGSTADLRFTAEATGDRVGTTVAGDFDENGDGFGDFLIGAPGESTNGAGAGATYLIVGR